MNFPVSSAIFVGNMESESYFAKMLHSGVDTFQRAGKVNRKKFIS